MRIILPDGLLEALEELELKPYEFFELEDLITEKEFEILEVIIYKHTKAEYRLYIKEMCKVIDKKGKLPTKYVKFTV